MWAQSKLVGLMKAFLRRDCSAVSEVWARRD